LRYARRAVTAVERGRVAQVSARRPALWISGSSTFSAVLDRRAQIRPDLRTSAGFARVGPRRTFALATHTEEVYASSMDAVSSAHGSKRGSQDETSPIPLEFEIVARRKRVVQREGRNQDETAPFPLEFEVVARKTKQSQDETSPFLLEFMVILPDGESAFVRTARPPRSRGTQSSLGGLPLLKWNGVNASRELRRYAARIAAGESLPPYRGPILDNPSLDNPSLDNPSLDNPSLDNGGLQRLRGAAQPVAHAPAPAAVDDSKAFVKFALALILMSALVVASAMLGSDAQLRGVGKSIRDWSSQLFR
jgi:hypothetical protein